MAKFDATNVETLDFDFSEWGGGQGRIDEPSTGRVNAFFKNVKAVMREATALQSRFKDIDLEEMSEEELAEQMGKIDESETETEEFQSKTIEYIAELCGATRDEDGVLDPTSGSPSMRDLEVLPFRVLQLFNQWLMEQIKPKKTASAGKR